MAALLLAAGPVSCQKPTPPAEPTGQSISDDELSALWDQALETLRRFGFRPDRQDRAAGIIRTSGETSMQWHEPWRQDTADGWGLLQSSLHTVQRRVTVRFVHEGDWRIEVQVDVFLWSSPEAQITTASSAIRSFNGDLPTVTGERLADARVNREWIPMGRDGAMEMRLLNSILD